MTALQLLLAGDVVLWSAILVSLKVCFFALLIASPPAVLLGFVLATFMFPGRRVLVVLLQTLLALPTVVIGLIFYLMLSRQGPLGEWH
ncbi:MAG TPA: ABC transporter permease, partial [Methylophilaceae bacterium]|nr:ABC transporter permease [Methylophilaceae bacterium]